MRNKDLIFSIYLLVICFCFGFLGYQLKGYFIEEEKIDIIKNTEKEKYLIKDNEELKQVVERQKILIDSLIDNKEIHNPIGFTMGGKSISVEDLLKYTNNTTQERDYYKWIVEATKEYYGYKIERKRDKVRLIFEKEIKDTTKIRE